MNKGMFRTIQNLDRMARMGQIHGFDSVIDGGNFGWEKDSKPVQEKIPEVIIKKKIFTWHVVSAWIKKREVLLMWLIGILITIFGWFV